MTFDESVTVRTLFGEARGEPPIGQKAVAHAIINRLLAKRFGATLAQVCLSHAQFSCWLQSDPNWKLLTGMADDDPLFAPLIAALVSAQAEDDFTDGATHYFAVSLVKKPIWILGATYVGQWGSQLFWKGVE